MAPKPVVFACSNPDPEISPAVANEARDDLIMATGRSDYPNQVNNVLCFPFLFRGTLDVRATAINEQMKLAAVHAIKDLAKEDADLAELYRGRSLAEQKSLDMAWDCKFSSDCISCPSTCCLVLSYLVSLSCRILKC